MKVEFIASQLLQYVKYLWNRIVGDRVNVNAGYLAYITLLSIVPLVAVLLSVLSSFPAFSHTGEVIQDFIITHFVPAAGEAVKGALTEFVANTGKMTALGGAFLFIAALVLISNIDRNLNYIWRVKAKRRAVFSFSMYWMVLTLGPILVGSSIAVTSYITSLRLLSHDTISGLISVVLGWLPLILSFAAFMGLYLLVPNKKIRFLHSATGALCAAIMFELCKKGFAVYIAAFPSYQVIYGAIAAIPILFVWVYLCWLIVLIGAEITASLGEKEQWCLASQSSDKESSSDSSDTESQ